MGRHPRHACMHPYDSVGRHHGRKRVRCAEIVVPRRLPRFEPASFRLELLVLSDHFFSFAQAYILRAGTRRVSIATNWTAQHKRFYTYFGIVEPTRPPSRPIFLPAFARACHCPSTAVICINIPRTLLEQGETCIPTQKKKKAGAVRQGPEFKEKKNGW